MASTVHDASKLFDEGRLPPNSSSAKTSTYGAPGAVNDTVSLHRALMRGSGFFEWMTHPALRPLPVVNFLQIDEKFVDALIQELSAEDRGRFRRYLSNRALGLGIITAGPGFGKTTAIAVATLAMKASFGKILCSGPSNVAVNVFAQRIDRITTSVTDRYNKGKSDKARTRRQLVVRGYKPQDEMDAFLNLLEHPTDGNNAAPGSGWQLHLSIAFWLLVVLRCPAVRTLHADDNPALHELRRKIEARDDLKALCAVVSGSMPWNVYQKGAQVKRDKLTVLMKEILGAADVLCTTPAMTVDCVPYSTWKKAAKGLVVDDAGRMTQKSLACLWGENLRPCFLAGDSKFAITADRDSTGALPNRFQYHCKTSPLLFLMATGIPVYRLRTQLRMADGQFDGVAAHMYPEVAFKYANCCQVSLPQLSAGQILEAFILEKYPTVTPSPAGKLCPVFINCKDSRVTVDGAGSETSSDQVRIALDLAVELIEEKGINPASISVLALFSGNLEVIAMTRNSPGYSALLSMPPASTVDGFQGKENDIIIAVMGTSYPRPGSRSFAIDDQRLNIMISRQRYGLVIVGDIKGKNNLHSNTGLKRWKNAKALRNLHDGLLKAGRIAEVLV
ncbi:P-loop containing nucleoside triphosphate hydrolase protein [Dactylonectria macrodidyma]|uniref:P-loop containing nucleoside triphosphate hydrolase protein n=1 Tax=Dactylonectria macrodidyma TaxID=307937 RepID=A0A9P9EWG0_9HYPO|nr:P-loop containing nucleoside triphosphate hydrolase protein [Dactylonectria macrodidyma]